MFILYYNMSTRLYDYILLPQQMNILFETYSVFTHEIIDSYIYVCIRRALILGVIMYVCMYPCVLSSKVLVIDEISMLSKDLFELLAQIAR